MGEYKDLYSKEAIEKLKEVCEKIRVCMLGTDLHKIPMNTRPMAVQEVDEEGNLWFISSKTSNKNIEIGEFNRVHLIFADAGDSKFISLYGEATVYTDRATIEEKWSPMAKAWFEDGKDNPDVTIIRVTPVNAYYWDTQDGKMISLIKVAAAVVTGKTHLDGSIEGNINV